MLISDQKGINQLSNEQKRISLPSFKEMITCVYEMSQKRLNTSTQRVVYGRVTLAYSYEIYKEVSNEMKI